MTVLELLREFEKKIDSVSDREPQTLAELIELRQRLIDEEKVEVDEALVNYDDAAKRGMSPKEERELREHLAKELADLVYVVYGTAERLDIDLDRAVEIVHESNLSKISSESDRRPDGKLLKPASYIAPDMSSVV